MSAVPDTTTPQPQADGLQLVLPGRALAAGSGWDWIPAGWKLFAAAPLMWILSVVLLFVAGVIISLVPFVGSLAWQALSPVVTAGFVVSCRAIERGGSFELENLFAGFRQRFGPLLIVGLLYIGAWILILLVFGMFVGFSILSGIVAGNTEEVMSIVAASLVPMLLGGLVVAGLGLLVVAAYWFAPALVMMHGMAPTAAMKESFFACFRNFFAFTVYGLVMLALAIVAVIPLGLGMLVWIPLAIASTYASYRAIFTEESAPAAPPPVTI